ncbi:9936_t:CDS:2 [Scutellospora calospora]|uniref:9936_t:CDS:1 n=1 Tax=Scutellospora calospora TaxID=85575 RepID=A0ACA9KMV7_9GLOM|nr:9936_t:CDS:2 [Scutellospora calospora]
MDILNIQHNNFMKLILKNDLENFKPSFPPIITKDEFVKRIGKRSLKKVPKFKLKHDEILPITELSKIISECWRNEPEYIKKEYSDIVLAVKEKLENLKQLKKIPPQIENFKKIRPKINIIDTDKLDNKYIENKTFINNKQIVDQAIDHWTRTFNTKNKNSNKARKSLVLYVSSINKVKKVLCYGDDINKIRSLALDDVQNILMNAYNKGIHY